MARAGSGRGKAPRWLTTAVLALSGMAAALQFTATVPLLPVMPGLLDVSPNDASWMVTITLLTSAIVTPVLARMADMYGKRRMILLALLAMTVGSVVVAAGSSYPTLIIGRALQGFAQALIPIGISLLRDLLPRERVGSAVALMSATLGIGSALGLPLSGVVYESFGWQAVFWSTAAIGSVLLMGVLALVRESPVKAPARFDLIGAALLSIILAALLLVISKAGRWDFAVIVALIGVGSVVLTAWIPLQLRVNNPMVDLRTTAKRPVLLTNTSTLFVSVGTFANMIVTVQQLQAPVATGYGFGLSAADAGVAMLPTGLVMVVLAPLAGALLNRWGGRRVLITGSVVLAAAFVFRVFVDDTIFVVILGATLVGAGTGLAFAALPTLLMASVPLTETASANGINALVRSIAMSITSAFLALLVTTMATDDNDAFLSGPAVDLCFWIAAGFGLVGAVIAAFIPVDTRVAGQTPERDSSQPETLVHGRVVLGSDVVARHPAIVTFMNLDGTPVDWSRADLDGNYSALLPGPGRYLAVANATGWAPRTHVLDAVGADLEWNATISEQLALSGRVSMAGRAAPGAIVAIHRATGEYVGSVRSDGSGRYCTPLPPAGPYLVTAIDADGMWAHSLKLIVGVQATTLDIAGRLDATSGNG